MNTYKNILTKITFALLYILGSAYSANAQAVLAPNQTNVAGKVVSLTGPELIVADRSGEEKVAISEKTIVRAELPIKFSEITSGMYVAATATKQADGNFLASQINIFSEDQRGISEGQRPLGNATMTNANVERVEDVTVRELKGRMLNLKYKGGEINVLVPADIPINKRVLGDRSLIKTGSEVSVTADKQADGSLTARQITVRAPKS